MQSESSEIQHLTAKCQYPMNNIAGSHNICSYISPIAKVKLTPMKHEHNFSRKQCMLLPYFMLASPVINIIFQVHNSYQLHSRIRKEPQN
jgi:hypothetical protein